MTREYTNRDQLRALRRLLKNRPALCVVECVWKSACATAPRTSGLSPCAPEDPGREPLRRVRNFVGGRRCGTQGGWAPEWRATRLVLRPPAASAPPQILEHGAARPCHHFLEASLRGVAHAVGCGEFLLQTCAKLRQCANRDRSTQTRLMTMLPEHVALQQDPRTASSLRSKRCHACACRRTPRRTALWNTEELNHLSIRLQQGTFTGFRGLTPRPLPAPRAWAGVQDTAPTRSR